MGKHVHFAPNDSLVTVHIESDWPTDVCTEARRGHWHRYTINRILFQKRIRKTEQVIGYCLSPAHRVDMQAKLHLKRMEKLN